MSDALLVPKLTLFAKKLFEDKFQRQQRDWIDKCLIEMGQAGQTVATALLALTLGRPPRDDEVQEALGKLANDPSFAARLHLLFSEALRSPSVARRKRLAGVLIAGPRITATEHKRDRLDRMVAQLGEDDIDTLQQILEVRDTHQSTGVDRVPYTVGQFTDGNATYLSSGFPGTDGFFKSPSTVDPISIDNLVGAGCVFRHATPPLTENISPLEVTELGAFLVRSLENELIQAALRTPISP